jgi:multiple sugar transport system ATP-binding protein
MARVLLEDVSKTYPNATTTAVDALTIEVADGEFMVLVGPSGCGKTTALRMIAGLEDPSLGRIFIGDHDVTDVRPRDRDVAMVFQDYALYPHMTVFENMGFGLKLRKADRATIERTVQDAARMLGLDELLTSRPAQLSGGQRQRVAMGRAIVRKPRVFLMDEPLSNLDAKLRVQMRAEIASLQHDLGVTTIYVTHDQVEAMTMGDRVAVMRKGELQQVADPQTLYDRPVNLFVGGFIGSPAMNMVEATLEARDGSYRAKIGGQSLAIDAETLAAHPALTGYVGRRVVLGIRPEHLEDAALAIGAPAEQRLHGSVDLTEALGSDLMVHFSIDAKRAITEEVRELAQDVGDERAVAQLAEGAPSHTRLVGRFSARSRVHSGEAVEVAVDSRGLHFFDPQTGLGIYDTASLAVTRALPANTTLHPSALGALGP